MGKNKQFSEGDLYDALRAKIDTLGQAAAAKELGFTPQFLNDVMNGRRTLSERLVTALGYRRVVTFERM